MSVVSTNTMTKESESTLNQDIENYEKNNIAFDPLNGFPWM